ncbi:Histidine kinase internal region [Sulfurimonas denitrificans DSM 1251]|jgi:sensor histidine kinase YesM|uniref:Histidine kinase internal region n=1 Tax=Sulfurimonas denitrificans (strain ATCC 33889 / DSM 1251) TaxID=326298 RepID=Q30S19_SULDN|nr:histidine kinase [Sulfurimonas denitrificans]ABB44212.1 Histidine kinase internal region [Sulfurimonas denitrificans DSM 1251]MDD3443599.1 histidine kinase [Sulfurimonas denitrificans]
MYSVALHIKTEDWLYILAIGIVFAMVLSSLGYGLFEFSLLDGAIFGVILGFSITIFSLIFVSNMNKIILPNVKEFYWLPLSILFSFLSGFLGTYFGVYVAQNINIEIIPAFKNTLSTISVAIGILTYIIGALLYRFVKMRNQKDVIDKEYVQSRLRSLETQLNPHFLFNALNSIAELIHQDPQKAEMAVLKLSSFLRNSMNETALLNLGDEISNLSDYVELENIRFSQKIKLHVQRDIPACKVPKFSLQLLVENAIKHGFKNLNVDLNIWISFDERTKTLIVRNDGDKMKSTKFGVGLNNLKQRIELLCGGSIKVANSEEVTFLIILGDCSENINR